MFVEALVSGGDGRLARDPRTGRNRYMLPPEPLAGVVCASSCTASPIDPLGFAAAEDAYDDIMGASTTRARDERLADHREAIAAAVCAHYGAAESARAIVCASGTDALLIAARLLATEAPHAATTAILTEAGETGAGVPRAVTGPPFDDRRRSTADDEANASEVTTIAIPLRDARGTPHPEDVVNDAYARIAAGVRGRAVVYQMYGTKTGLIAPSAIPSNIDVVVDACQARIGAAAVRAHLAHGRPVAITGSKFFGGPAFSGALLVPRDRFSAAAMRTAAALEGALPREGPLGLGPVLRWTAALPAMQAFAAREESAAALLDRRMALVEAGIAAQPALVALPGLARFGDAWSERASIASFCIRDRRDAQRLLTPEELRPIYETLAADGVFVGQPVTIGAFGALRIAIGARELLDPTTEHDIPRLFAALDAAVRSAVRA